MNEKQARESTGHRSDSLFRYQKQSEKQVKVVSDAVAPPVDLSFSTSEFKQDETYWSSIVDDEISDEVLASLDIPDCTLSSRQSCSAHSSVMTDSLQSKDCTDVVRVEAKKDKVQREEKLSGDSCGNVLSPVFNNCTVNFWMAENKEK